MNLARIGFVLAAIPLSSCATLLEWVGLRTNLEEFEIEKIVLKEAHGRDAICPGDRVNIGISAFEKDGTEHRSINLTSGKVDWRHFVLTSPNASIDDGVLYFPHDPRETIEDNLSISGYLASNSQVKGTIVLSPTFDCQFEAVFAGAHGLPGSAGSSGLDGVDGRSQSDLPGGHGTPGGHGWQGGWGSSGEDGPSLKVLIALSLGKRKLIAVKIVDLTTLDERYFALEPKRGSLRIVSKGGKGGDGGPGGNGGSGGKGGSGNPNGRDAPDGTGGSGGNGGPGGRGGQIAIVADPQTKPYIDQFEFSNPGGSGGTGGQPGYNSYVSGFPGIKGGSGPKPQIVWRKIDSPF